ncbi:hypothetical protein Chor_001408 [Crotalus horridus]
MVSDEYSPSPSPLITVTHKPEEDTFGVSIAVGLAAFACVLLVVLFIMINKYGRRSKFGMKGTNQSFLPTPFNEVNAGRGRGESKSQVFWTYFSSGIANNFILGRQLCGVNKYILKLMEQNQEDPKYVLY